MSFEQKIVASEAQRTRRWAIAAFLFALVATLLDLGAMLADAAAAIRFAWELDYGEGIVWEQMRLMVAGDGYRSIDGLPAIVFHYPPVFHMVTAGLSGLTGLDPLAVGRSVSLGSTLLIGLFGGLIAGRTVRADDPLRTAVLCGTTACLTTFCFAPIAFWAPLMRVDPLSLALSFGAVLVAMGALARPRLILVSALLFVAAVFTKQTSIVAPAAVFLTFLLVRPRLAWTLLAGCVAAGLLVLGALMLATDGTFVRHIFLYNSNRFDAGRLILTVIAVSSHFLFFAVLLVGVTTRLRVRLPLYRGARSVAELRARLSSAPGDAFFLLILVYALLAGLMTLTIAKVGSNQNYFVEWMAVLAVLLGISVRDAANAVLGVATAPTKRLFAYPFLLPLMIGLQAIAGAPLADYAGYCSPRRAAEMRALQAMVAAAPRPVISDNMVLLLRSSVPVQVEPAIFAELSSKGVWDEAPFVDRIRARQFAFFVTDGVRGQDPFDKRYNPNVADAIDAAYPIKRKMAGYTLHLPARSPTQGGGSIDSD